LQTTQTLQTLQTPAFVTPTIDFFSSLNDPIPSIIALAVWLVGLIVIGLVARARGRSPVKWFQSAAGLIITVGIAGGLNFSINWLVARDRPGTFCEKIRVLGHIPSIAYHPATLKTTYHTTASYSNSASLHPCAPGVIAGY